MVGLFILYTTTAFAAVDPACKDVASQGVPDGYSEEGQQNYLLNYFAMAASFSPIHGPIPNPAGTGSVGVELSVIPPLSCERRLVLNYTKTEDTNKTPAVPRPRISFSFPAIETAKLRFVPYAGLGYVPPVPIMGTQNVIISVESGVGVKAKGSKGMQYGLRGHATLMKSVAEIATPFVEGDEAFDDLYIGSTFGVDAMLGFFNKGLTTYGAIGFTDVSTFFYITDDGVVSDNTDPFAGFTGSLGAQYRLSDSIQLGGEFYTAPGLIYTGRFRVSYMLR